MRLTNLNLSNNAFYKFSIFLDSNITKCNLGVYRYMIGRLWTYETKTTIINYLRYDWRKFK